MTPTTYKAIVVSEMHGPVPSPRLGPLDSFHKELDVRKS